MKIRMIHSVGEHVAGTEVDLPEDEADRFLALGYAEGDISGDYSEAEWQAFIAEQRKTAQVVTI